MSVRLRRFCYSPVVVWCVALAGCGGGGGSAPTPPTVSPTAMPTLAATAAPSSIAISITFPGTTGANGSLRHRSYVSPSIASLAIAVDGSAPIYVNAPTPTGSPNTVTTTIPLPPGNHTFVLGEFDQANGAGNLLGRVAASATVIAAQSNTLGFTLNGELSKIVVQQPATPFVEGTLPGTVTLVGCQPQTFTALPEDADGNVIITPGLLPQIAATSASSAIVANAVATNQFTLEAPAPTTSTAVTASGVDLNGKTVSTSIDVGATAAFYIADFTVQKIRAFDESGTPLALASTAFSGISNPMGLAATPCSATASGDLYLTETSNFTYPYVQEFDMNGVSQPLASTAFAFDPGNYDDAQPLLLTYAAGTLYVPDLYSSMVSAFGLDGTTQSFAALTNLKQPVGIAYATNDKQFYVTNEGTATLSAYSAAGAYIGNVATNSHPFGVAFDSNNDSLYVTSGGTTGGTLDGTTASPANVAEYSEVPAAVSTTGGFAATSTTAYYTGIAFDPYSKQLYVADAGDSVIVAYTEAGAAVTLPSGAFSTINATSTPKADPMAILFVP